MKKYRAKIVKWLFSEHEMIAIINALYRRNDDDRTIMVKGDDEIKSICRKIANELMQ